MDDEDLNHYVSKNAIMRGIMYGEPKHALCGVVLMVPDVQIRDVVTLPMCPVCERIHASQPDNSVPVNEDSASRMTVLDLALLYAGDKASERGRDDHSPRQKKPATTKRRDWFERPGEPVASAIRYFLSHEAKDARSRSRGLIPILGCTVRHAQDLYTAKVAYTEDEIDRVQSALKFSDRELRRQVDWTEERYAPERVAARTEASAYEMGRQMAALVWNCEDDDFLDIALVDILDDMPEALRDPRGNLRHLHVRAALQRLADELRIAFPERPRMEVQP